jgi:hypothetical protein
VKSEICKPCKYFKKCNGVLKVYIDTYWEWELKPITE